MEGFTGIRDLDKELMLKMGDREFIRTCQLNKYFQDICKDDYFFKRRLENFIRIHWIINMESVGRIIILVLLEM